MNLSSDSIGGTGEFSPVNNLCNQLFIIVIDLRSKVITSESATGGRGPVSDLSETRILVPDTLERDNLIFLQSYSSSEHSESRSCIFLRTVYADFPQIFDLIRKSSIPTCVSGVHTTYCPFGVRPSVLLSQNIATSSRYPSQLHISLQVH